jgi:hypothetical protein
MRRWRVLNTVADEDRERLNMAFWLLKKAKLFI